MKKKTGKASYIYKLFKVADEKGYSQDEVRNVLALKVNGKRLSESTSKEVGRVIDFVEGKLVEWKVFEGGHSYAIVFCTAAQKGMIEELKKLIVWEFEDGFERWIKKFFKVNDEFYETLLDAQKIIEGLKAMARRA